MLWTDAIAHLAQCLFVIGFVVTDIFRLRLIVLLAIALETVYLYFGPDQPLWVYISWNTVFVVANAINILLLIRERRQPDFTDDERELYDTLFHQFSEMEFRKLMRASTWTSVPAGETLTTAGEPVQNIQLIYNGRVSIQNNDTILGTLKDGQFVGEMSFMTGKPATATAVSETPVKLIYWSQEELKQLLARNPALAQSLEHLFNLDLVRKLNG